MKSQQELKGQKIRLYPVVKLVEFVQSGFNELGDIYKLSHRDYLDILKNYNITFYIFDRLDLILIDIYSIETFYKALEKHLGLKENQLLDKYNELRSKGREWR